MHFVRASYFAACAVVPVVLMFWQFPSHFLFIFGALMILAAWAATYIPDKFAEAFSGLRIEGWHRALPYLMAPAIVLFCLFDALSKTS